MPRQKRKAAAAPVPTVASATPARKKVRIGDQSVIDEDNSRTSTPGSSGRLRRSTSNENPQYNFTRIRAPNSATAAGRGKGKAASVATVALPKRGRGRPPKKAQAVEVEVEDEEQIEDAGDTEAEAEAEEEVEPVKKAAGRKGILKNKAPQGETAPTIEVGVNGASVPAKRGRGRPKDGSDAKPKTEKKRGRPANRLRAEELDGLNDEEALNKGATALLHESVDPEVQYWLMKAEPESRIEKGVDVKFSIDDLAAKTESEGWDGKSHRCPQCTSPWTDH